MKTLDCVFYIRGPVSKGMAWRPEPHQPQRNFDSISRPIRGRNAMKIDIAMQIVTIMRFFI